MDLPTMDSQIGSLQKLALRKVGEITAENILTVQELKELPNNILQQLLWFLSGRDFLQLQQEIQFQDADTQPVWKEHLHVRFYLHISKHQMDYKQIYIDKQFNTLLHFAMTCKGDDTICKDLLKFNTPLHLLRTHEYNGRSLMTFPMQEVLENLAGFVKVLLVRGSHCEKLLNIRWTKLLSTLVHKVRTLKVQMLRSQFIQDFAQLLTFFMKEKKLQSLVIKEHKLDNIKAEKQLIEICSGILIPNSVLPEKYTSELASDSDDQLSQKCDRLSESTLDDFDMAVQPLVQSKNRNLVQSCICSFMLEGFSSAMWLCFLYAFPHWTSLKSTLALSAIPCIGRHMFVDQRYTLDIQDRRAMISRLRRQPLSTLCLTDSSKYVLDLCVDIFFASVETPLVKHLNLSSCSDVPHYYDWDKCLTSYTDLPEDPNFYGVEHLNLSHNSFDAQGGRAVAYLVQHSKGLRVLDLQDCDFGSTRNDIYKAVIANGKIEELILAEPEIHSGLSAAVENSVRSSLLLSVLGTCSNLSVLNLSWCLWLCKHENIKELAEALGSHPTLQDLSLKGVDGREDLVSLLLHMFKTIKQQSPRWNKLQYLDISSNRLKENDLAPLADILTDIAQDSGYPALKILDISYVDWTQVFLDQGLELVHNMKTYNEWQRPQGNR